MEHSPEIKDIATALAKFQGEMENASKDSNNPFFNSKYADIAEIWDTVRSPLSKNGLSLLQPLCGDGETYEVTTPVKNKAGDIIGEKSEVSFGSLLDEISSELVSNGIDIKTTHLPVVLCDKEKTGQIFRNLILNAIEHAKAKEISFTSQSEDDGIAILVSNDGVPISEKNRPRIFVSGFTTKSDGGGLGLNIVLRIVQAHGWKIFLESDERTTFRLFIPSVDIISN